MRDRIQRIIQRIIRRIIQRIGERGEGESTTNVLLSQRESKGEQKERTLLSLREECVWYLGKNRLAEPIYIPERNESAHAEE